MRSRHSRLARAAAAWSCVCLLAPSAWPASPADELEVAMGLYRDGRFTEAIARLQSALGKLALLPDPELRRRQSADAYLHLGLAHLALQERDEAREAFRQMLRADPGRRLDPDTYAPKVIALFEEARASLPSPVPSPAAHAKPARSWRLPLILVGTAGAAAAVGLASGGGAKSGASSGPPSIGLRCEPTTLSLVHSPVSSLCAVSAGAGEGSVRVDLSCEGHGSVPCRPERESLTVEPQQSLAVTVLIAVAYQAQPGFHPLEVTATWPGGRRTVIVQVQVAPDCAGFMERPSNTQSECINLPPVTTCRQFDDGYLWISDADSSSSGFSLGPCEGRRVQVLRGFSAEYHHVLGTLFAKVAPRSR